FWRGIRLYYREHRDGLASTADLRRAMEEVSHQDLRGFFAQWLNRSGVPQLTGSWKYDAGRKQVTVNLRQTQPGNPYRFPLGIGVTATFGAQPSVRQFEVTDREAIFTIPADAEPSSVTLDPNVWLLADFGTFQKAP